MLGRAAGRGIRRGGGSEVRRAGRGEKIGEAGKVQTEVSEGASNDGAMAAGHVGSCLVSWVDTEIPNNSCEDAVGLGPGKGPVGVLIRWEWWQTRKETEGRGGGGMKDEQSVRARRFIRAWRIQ